MSDTASVSSKQYHTYGRIRFPPALLGVVALDVPVDAFAPATSVTIQAALPTPTCPNMKLLPCELEAIRTQASYFAMFHTPCF